jgi:hypothetical protein
MLRFGWKRQSVVYKAPTSSKLSISGQKSLFSGGSNHKGTSPMLAPQERIHANNRLGPHIIVQNMHQK